MAKEKENEVVLEEEKTKKKSKKDVEIEAKEKQYNELNDVFHRMAAEYDNFKKRSQKEKDSLRESVTADVVAKFLDVSDNLERAITVIEATEKNEAVYEGLNMVWKQLKDTFNSLDVEPIESVGEQFNPELHNAVMHVEDDSVGNNVIVEEFQKGYIMKDKVIRHSMVKVAN